MSREHTSRLLDPTGFSQSQEHCQTNDQNMTGVPQKPQISRELSQMTSRLSPSQLSDARYTENPSASNSAAIQEFTHAFTSNRVQHLPIDDLTSRRQHWSHKRSQSIPSTASIGLGSDDSPHALFYRARRALSRVLFLHHRYASDAGPSNLSATLGSTRRRVTLVGLPTNTPVDSSISAGHDAPQSWVRTVARNHTWRSRSSDPGQDDMLASLSSGLDNLATTRRTPPRTLDSTTDPRNLDLRASEACPLQQTAMVINKAEDTHIEDRPFAESLYDKGRFRRAPRRKTFGRSGNRVSRKQPFVDENLRLLAYSTNIIDRRYHGQRNIEEIDIETDCREARWHSPLREHQDEENNDAREPSGGHKNMTEDSTVTDVHAIDARLQAPKIANVSAVRSNRSEVKLPSPPVTTYKIPKFVDFYVSPDLADHPNPFFHPGDDERDSETGCDKTSDSGDDKDQHGDNLEVNSEGHHSDITDVEIGRAVRTRESVSSLSQNPFSTLFHQEDETSRDDVSVVTSSPPWSIISSDNIISSSNSTSDSAEVYEERDRTSTHSRPSTSCDGSRSLFALTARTWQYLRRGCMQADPHHHQTHPLLGDDRPKSSHALSFLDSIHGQLFTPPGPPLAKEVLQSEESNEGKITPLRPALSAAAQAMVKEIHDTGQQEASDVPASQICAMRTMDYVMKGDKNDTKESESDVYGTHHRDSPRRRSQEHDSKQSEFMGQSSWIIKSSAAIDHASSTHGIDQYHNITSGEHGKCPDRWFGNHSGKTNEPYYQRKSQKEDRYSSEAYSHRDLWEVRSPTATYQRSEVETLAGAQYTKTLLKRPKIYNHIVVSDYEMRNNREYQLEPATAKYDTCRGKRSLQYTSSLNKGFPSPIRLGGLRDPDRTTGLYLGSCSALFKDNIVVLAPRPSSFKHAAAETFVWPVAWNRAKHRINFETKAYHCQGKRLIGMAVEPRIRGGAVGRNACGYTDLWHWSNFATHLVGIPVLSTYSTWCCGLPQSFTSKLLVGKDWTSPETCSYSGEIPFGRNPARRS